jgi:hypothetical protein
VPLPNHPESDPLAAFDAESATVPAETSLPADPPATPVDRAAEEIAALKAQVATLVAALEEIKRRPCAAPARSPARLGAAGAAAAGAAALLWAFAPPATRAPLPPSALVPPVAAASAVPAEPPRVPLLDTRQPPAPAAPEPLGGPRRDEPRTYVGTLTIDAEPAGEVFINRERAGRTPLRVRNLRAGSHLVWIERDGYRRWTRVVPVPADRVSRVSATLERSAP